MDDDELWAVYTALEAMVNYGGIDFETNNLIMDMEEEALSLLRDIVEARGLLETEPRE